MPNPRRDGMVTARPISRHFGVGAEVLFASLLGFVASSKRTKGSRVGYNIFAVIGFGLSTAYFIWAIDIGFFAWIPFVLMVVLLTGLGNSGSI